MSLSKNLSGASSLSDVNQLVSKCRKCQLHKTKTSDVFGSGSENAEIMFIGEAPGKEEDIKGEPFVGAAGRFLEEMIERIGLNREDVFIANVLKHRPPKNRDPYPDEIESCWPYLQKQIEIIGPLLVVFLGRHALNRFFPEMKISAVHGQAFRKIWYPDGKRQVFLALYHPAAALYNGSMRKVLMKDFEKIPILLKKIKNNN